MEHARGRTQGRTRSAGDGGYPSRPIKSVRQDKVAHGEGQRVRESREPERIHHPDLSNYLATSQASYKGVANTERTRVKRRRVQIAKGGHGMLDITPLCLQANPHAIRVDFASVLRMRRLREK